MFKVKDQSPFVIALITLLVVGSIMLIPLDAILTSEYFSEFQIEYIGLALKMSILLLLAVIAVYKLKSFSGLSSKYKWSYRYLNLIPVYLFLLGIFTFISKDLSQINVYDLLLLLMACLTVGFAEEFIFRGFLQPVFLKRYITHKRGIFLGVLLPAVSFGLAHLFNLAVNDNVPQVIGQVIYATFIGFFFGVTLLKTNKLIPLAITHGLINFFFLISSLPGLEINADTAVDTTAEATLSGQISEAAAPILIFLPLLITGLILLRKIEKEKVMEKFAD